MCPRARESLILAASLLLNVSAASAQDAGADSASTPPPASAPVPGQTQIIEETVKSTSSVTTEVLPPTSGQDFTGIISPQPSAVVQRSTEAAGKAQVGPLTVKKVYAPMYKQRISDYSEQLQLGVTRGWLNAEQSAHFSSELDRLKQLEAGCAAQQYSRSCLDELDKQFTLFNIEFSNALQQVPIAKPNLPAPNSTAPASTPPPSPAPAPDTCH